MIGHSMNVLENSQVPAFCLVITYTLVMKGFLGFCQPQLVLCLNPQMEFSVLLWHFGLNGANHRGFLGPNHNWS